MNHVQEDVIARDLETVAKQLLGHDVHVHAVHRTSTRIDSVLGNHQVRGTATNINAGHGNAIAVGFVRARQGGKKLFRVTGKVLGNFGIEVNQLPARGLIPVDVDERQRGGWGLCLIGVRVFVAVVPAHAFPDQANGLRHTLAQDAAFSLWHAGRHGQGDAVELARDAGSALARTLGRAVDLCQRLGQDLGQHERHQRAARIERLEHRHLVVFGQAVQRLTEVVDQVRKRGGRRGWLAVIFDVGVVEAPAMVVGVFIPQVALGAGQAG